MDVQITSTQVSPTPRHASRLEARRRIQIAEALTGLPCCAMLNVTSTSPVAAPGENRGAPSSATPGPWVS
ncbi:hypothetical protein [Caballeronia sp. AZ10_KS36]|uniref:hypothetical protein n=1 Tax=Caballeronia sp. AZ10_KS36 TaxID=2921757 RepID=UPI0020287720|nr:hypothetical protein [Caballeronia sp. AZ10_KS36]